MPEELDKTAETATPGKKKFPFKIVLMAVLGVAIISGAGFYLFKKGNSGPSGPSVKQKQEEASPLIALDPFILNLADPGRFLKMTLEVEVAGPDGATLVNTRKAQLRDAIITLLGNKTSDDISTADGKMQLKDELILRINQELGRPVIKNVYFTEFVMQ